MRLFTAVMHHRSDSDWSVVATAETEHDAMDKGKEKPCDWRLLANAAIDMKVKDLFCSISRIIEHYKQEAVDILLRLWVMLKLAFWPLLTVAYFNSVWNVAYTNYFSSCHQREMHHSKVMDAYESLYNEELRLPWRKYSQYVNTPDFIYRYFAINVACWVCM